MSPVPYGSTGAQRFTSAPAVGQAGATYYNTTLSQMFASDGTSWVLHTPSPGDALVYQFSTTTTDADPGTGFMRLNAGTQNTATQAFLDLTQFGGGTANTWVLSWDDLGSPPYGVLTIIEPGNVGNYLIFQVTSVTAATGYNKVGLTLLASNPNSPFANNDIVNVYFDRVPAPSASFDGPFLQPVRLVSPTNHGLSGLAAIDGVTPVAGDRIGAFYQTTGSQNGIYVAASGAWARSADAATAASMAKGTRVWSTEGSQNAWREWMQVNTFTTLGTDTALFRVRDHMDTINAFFPTPLGNGHTVYDSASASIQVFDAVGVLWRTANGVIACTSTTRPANPRDGNIIYETDTAFSYIRISGAWVLFGNANNPIPASMPKGNLGYAQITAGPGTTATTTVTDIPGLSATVTTDGTRRVKVSTHIFVNTTVANDRAISWVREGTTGLGASYGPPMIQTASAHTIDTAWVGVPTSGSHTYVASFARAVGTGTIGLQAGATTPAYILVEDIGV